eukprot:7391819-Prymnesium_polylepis.2
MKTREWCAMERSVGVDGERRAKYRKACEAVESLPAAHARLLAVIEDKMGAAVKQWPDDPRTKMLGSRLDFKGRFSLFLFAVGNQCPPELFVDWVITRKLLRFQESANHLIGVVKAHKTGMLEQQGKTYWDLDARDVRTIITPTFAAEVDPSYMCKLDGNGVEVMPPGCEFWDRAIKKLEAHAGTLLREPKSF